MASESNLIAVRYVRALFDLVKDDKQHDLIKQDMLTLKLAIESSFALQKFLHNPIVTREESAKAIAEVLNSFKANDLTQKFFSLLAHQRRLAITLTIIEKYIALLAESRGELSVDIIYAGKLDDKQVKVISDAIANATSKKVTANLHQDASLIGGVQIKIGDKLLDNSVKGKLSRLRSALAKTA